MINILFPLFFLAQAGDATFMRYEVGERLRLFERWYDDTPDPAKRAAAAKGMNEAVQAFFRMDLGGAARSIDDAFADLDGRRRPDSIRLVNSLGFDPTSRFIDDDQDRLLVRLREVYASGVVLLEQEHYTIEFVARDPAHDDEPTEWLHPDDKEIVIKGLPAEVTLDVGKLGEADHRIAITWGIGRGFALAQDVEWPILSVVERRDERIAAARATIDRWPDDRADATTDRESARSLLALLEGLAKGRTMESDIYAAAELKELEAILAADSEGRAFHGPGKPGSHRVVLKAPGGRTAPARVFVPEGLDAGRPVPLVVALHGAGGTENLFFEGYGHGKIVDLCRERGWLLVAPRVTPIGGAPPLDLVEAMAALYPVNPGRVFVVGHSMGAAAAVGAASRSPERFAGLAALGGGGRIAPSEAIQKLPTFVGVGSLDFALRGAKALDQTLRAAGLERVEFKEYADVEHLLVVQVALPEVFTFFDSITPDEKATQP